MTNDQRRRVGASLGKGSGERLQDIESIDEEASDIVEPLALCKLLDSEFDDLPDCSGPEMERWLGCPTSTATTAEDWDA